MLYKAILDTPAQQVRGSGRWADGGGVTIPIVPVRAGDVVRLKKAHPCGANEWEVHKLGMDIGLTCLGCGRKVRLERYDFDRRFRGFERRSDETLPES